jgi:transcriptional regulator with XRE-family HTH domain
MNAWDLGRRIRRVREQAGLSQRDLAERVELDQSQVSRIENGERSVSVTELYQIAAACQTTVKDILEGE